VSVPDLAGRDRSEVRGSVAEVAAAITDNQKFLLTTHEGPDGDALGSLLGTHELLKAMGKDSVMFLAAKEFPLPSEYRHMALENVFHEPPADLSDRVVIFLDCGNIDRMPVDFLRTGGKLVVNVDHHHDNTDFGDVQLVDPGASSTAELVFELSREMDVRLTPLIASSLYIGIVTDTGRFMYSSADARTHEIVAELIRAGVDVDDTNIRVYESLPAEKIRLLGRALDRMELECGGQLVVTYLTAHDYRELGAGEEMTEGIIDHLRSLEGIRVAAVVKDQVTRGGAERRVSFRSKDDGTDVSALARSFGGGGHVRAAGCSTDLTYPEVIEKICLFLNDDRG